MGKIMIKQVMQNIIRTSVTAGILILSFSGTALGAENDISAKSDRGLFSSEESLSKEEKGNDQLSGHKKRINRCVGPVNMHHGLTLPNGRYQVRVKHIYTHRDDLYDGGEKQTGSYTGKYDLVENTTQFMFKAGLLENFEARVMAPFIHRRMKQKNGNPPVHANTAENSGLGDTIVKARYALMDERKGDSLSMAAEVGLKLPTGDTGKKNEAPFSANNKYMGPNFQLGTDHGTHLLNLASPNSLVHPDWISILPIILQPKAITAQDLATS